MERYSTATRPLLNTGKIIKKNLRNKQKKKNEVKYQRNSE